MTKSYKLLIGALIAVMLIGFIFGVFGFVRGLQNIQEDSFLPDEAVSVFRKELTGRALARGPHPIEGFGAPMLLGTFPGLEENDFDGVATGAGIEADEGIHSYVDGELKWERTASRPITSAAQTVSQAGYATLLDNLSRRLGMPASSAEEAVAIVDEVDIPSDITDHIISNRDLIRVYTPRPLSVITSPLTVWGEARGQWYFEADFQLMLVDWDGRIIAESYATARDDWMTEEFVPFEGMVEFELSEENRIYNRGTLIFRKANLSGLPENSDALEIPVLFE